MTELGYGEWSSGPVKVVTDFFGRLVGIHGSPSGWGVLIPGKSVHGMFILHKLWAVGLDKGLGVVGVRMLTPGRLLVFRGADAVLELRSDRTPPRPGWTLTWKEGRSPWPGS